MSSEILPSFWSRLKSASSDKKERSFCRKVGDSRTVLLARELSNEHPDALRLSIVHPNSSSGGISVYAREFDSAAIRSLLSDDVGIDTSDACLGSILADALLNQDATVTQHGAGVQFTSFYNTSGSDPVKHSFSVSEEGGSHFSAEVFDDLFPHLFNSSSPEAREDETRPEKRAKGAETRD